MKVNDPNLTGITPDKAGGAELNPSRQTDAVGRGGASERNPALGNSPDSVSLSELGGRLRALNVDSPERVAHLEKLSSDVAAKRYQVDAGEVSHRLVEGALRPKE